MLLSFYYLILFIFLILFTSLSLIILKKYRPKKAYKILMYSLAILLFIISFSRFYGGHDYLEFIKNFDSKIFNKFETIISLLSNWFINGAIYIVIFNIFYPTRVSKILVKYVSTPIFIFNLFTLNYLILGSTETLNFFLENTIYHNTVYNFRALLIAIELGLAISLVINIWIKDHSFKITKNDIKTIILGFLLIIFVAFPSYILNILFDSLPSTVVIEEFTFYHRILLYLAFILPLIYYFTLKQYDNNDKRFLLILISIYALISYSGDRRYEIWTSWYSLPLHLCNTAMYIIPLTLIFKTHKIFYFTMYINVIGAFLALILPNSEDYSYINQFGSSIIDWINVVEFYVNHYYAFFMPILIVALKLYERPRFKFFTYSMIGFFIYYVSVLVINVINASNGHPTNYFFINGDFIPETLGKWAENIYDIEGNTWRTISITWNNKTYVFRWLYQLLFYLVYVGFSCLMWGFYIFLFSLQNEVDELHNKIIFKSKEFKNYFILPSLNQYVSLSTQENYLFNLKQYLLIKKIVVNKKESNKDEIKRVNKDIYHFIKYNYLKINDLIDEELVNLDENYFEYKKNERNKLEDLYYLEIEKHKELQDKTYLKNLKITYLNDLKNKKNLYKEKIKSLNNTKKKNIKEMKKYAGFAGFKNELELYSITKDIKGESRMLKNLDKKYLELINFSKKYEGNDYYSVKDFSLYLESGKIHGFLGKNGAGKSTIIKSIVGIQDFNDGEINICGYNIKKDPVKARECIGYVPDHYALYENLTGREYVNYIADLYNVTYKDRTEIINSLVKRFDLEARFNYPIKSYSHGMKQKITIMSALVHNPPIWILDEPLTGLDPNSIYQVKECMREHAKKGNIVFFSSHLIDIVENLCDDITIIKKGKFITRKDLKELKEENINLEEFYLDKTKDEEEISK